MIAAASLVVVEEGGALGVFLILAGLFMLVSFGVLAGPLPPSVREDSYSQGLRSMGRVGWKVGLGLIPVGIVVLLVERLTD